MTTKPIFPYRRNRKRQKPGRRREGGRRIPQSPAELLPLIQPATKALAQMLAGHTRSSGQLVHARNILEQAERLAQDRLLDRLPPARREEFCEQLARLKLTIADAEAMLAEKREVEEVEEAETPPPAVSPERLRALALSLAASTSTPPEQPPAEERAPVTEATAEPTRPSEREPETAQARPTVAHSGGRRERLRLKVTQSPPNDGS
jgi:hypothetical protein